MGIAEKLALLTKEIPRNVKVIAVSKTIPVPLIMEAYRAGQRAFGENKVQELLQKQPQLPNDIEWHLIGHLQTNKVKAVVPVVNLIHSVDSLRLLSEIDREASNLKLIVGCLLQIRIAAEETKYGMTYEDAVNLLSSDEYRNFTGIRVNGLMGIATFTEDANQIRKEFSSLTRTFHLLKSQFFESNDGFKELSLGMSGDYKLGIAAGSTMVRIGTLIFGERDYQ
jgi:pyridoxal phosphate enzyme (YggS family)